MKENVMRKGYFREGILRPRKKGRGRKEKRKTEEGRDGEDRRG